MAQFIIVGDAPKSHIAHNLYRIVDGRGCAYFCLELPTGDFRYFTTIEAAQASPHYK